MRRSASEIIRNLETRIARLEKQATHVTGMDLENHISAEDSFVDVLESITKHLPGFRVKKLTRPINTLMGKGERNIGSYTFITKVQLEGNGIFKLTVEYYTYDNRSKFVDFKIDTSTSIDRQVIRIAKKLSIITQWQQPNIMLHP